MIRIASVLFYIIFPLFTMAQTPETEHRWDIRFESFFSRDNTPVPLNVYARERGNIWVSGVGSSRIPGSQRYSFNKSYHPVNFSKVTIQNGQMNGIVTLHVTPDNWMPPSHKCFAVEIEVHAVIADGKIDGSWKRGKAYPEDPAAAGFGVEGKIDGVSKDYTPPSVPELVSFSFDFASALPGGDPAFGDRTIVVTAGCQNNKLISLRAGILGKGSRVQEVVNVVELPVGESSIAYDNDSVKGRLVYDGKDADENPCRYTFTFDGRLMEDFNVGTYKMTAEIPGKTLIQQDGSYFGRWNAGAKASTLSEADTRPWWTPVKDFKPVQPGEHPRLLFRKDKVSALRERAKTPEGKAIVERLKFLLGGGDAMPAQVSPSTKAYEAKKPMPYGAYSISHAAGFGLLYQLTGDKKYAELAKQCFEWGLEGKRNTDDRYAFRKPGGALRAGPTLAWYAIAYDLCYDAWDDATRSKFGKALAEYNDGKEDRDAKSSLSLETLVRGTQPPGSNHFGMQIGGAAVVLLAVMGDPGINDADIQRLLKISENTTVRNISEGFGDGGFFAEGDGTGSMASHIVYDTALLCWKNAKGMDFVNSSHPNARMINLKWIYLTVIRNGKPDFWPIRGAYGHNVWDREDLSGSGYFAIGMSAVTDEQRLAMKWYYDTFLAENDKKISAPFDTVSRYPHVAISSFLNWPIGQQGKNPADVLPLCYHDSRFDFFAWRNRWQDENDIVISTLAKTTTAGNYSARAEGKLSIAAFGKKLDWAELASESKSFKSSPMGQTSIVDFNDGTALAVDFTTASGADAMLVYTGKAKGKTIPLGDKTITIGFFTHGAEPEPKLEGDKIVVGKQSISLKNGSIVFGLPGK